MPRNARIPFYLILLLALYMLPAFATQEPKVVAPTEALKARVVLYYGSLQKGDKTTALDLVAPEAKDGFVHMNYDGLQGFRILDMRLSDAGDTATVRLLRSDTFPGFPQILDHETVDTWKQIGGQWCVLLPVPKENETLDTPFGKINFARRNDQQATPLVMPLRQVSPEEAKQALQRAMLEANKKKSSDRDKKPEDKKSEDQSAPKPNPPN